MRFDWYMCAAGWSTTFVPVLLVICCSMRMFTAARSLL
jgi:hypothetical protein